MKKRLKEAVKKGLTLIGVDPQKMSALYRRYRQMRGYDVAYNVNQTHYAKNCLLQYIVAPFMDENLQMRHTHQNQWQIVVLAELVGQLGYNVDVRDFDNRGRLKNYYDIVIDIYPSFNDTYRMKMNKSCRRIAYLTGMNPSIANKNEQMRLDALAQRRGILLSPERQTAEISREIEKFDAFFYIGNSYNLKSFDEFCLPPVHFIKNTGYTFPFSPKTSNKKAGKFLFFASSGQVHKGLDLLLEIFSQENFPFELYICSTFKSEANFCTVYKKELFHTSNIHPIGFVDIMGEQFREIAEECAFALLPSCSEGVAGSVLTVMSAGVIPIVSRECGFDDDEVIQLQDCKIETIEQMIYHYARKSNHWIESEARRIQQIVRVRYSNEAFIRSVQIALQSVLLPSK